MNATSYLITKESDTYFDIPRSSVQLIQVSKKTYTTSDNPTYQYFVKDVGEGTEQEYKEWCKLNNKEFSEPNVKQTCQYELSILLTNGMQLLFVSEDAELVSSIETNKDIKIYYGI